MTYPPSHWRLILTPPAPGAWNMAVDEAILEAVGQGQAEPTLRLYAWSPPCLSLGYAQPSADVDLPRLHSLGWHIVRRPTGGRAILHTDELTYSVIAPLAEPRLAGSLLESYQSISRALLQALSRLGISAQSLEKTAEITNSNIHNPVCFEVPSNYEITAQGLKLIGSAQARRKEGLLQHGSLPICGDLTRITQVLYFPDENSRSAAAKRLRDHAATVEDILQEKVTWENAAEAFAGAFRETWNLDLYQADLDSAELARAEELVQSKYGHPSWTHRV